MPEVAFKLMTAADLRELERTGLSQGGANDLADGFIHMSTADQVDRIFQRRFADVLDAWILVIRLDAFGERLRWEISRDGELYPHLYGPLTIDVVVAARPIEQNADGSISMPAFA